MLEVAQKYLQLKSGEYYKYFGKVDKVVGLTIESIGPKAKLNDLCMIFLDKERRDYVMSEVVGFKDSHIILMPFDNVEGVGVGCIVENTGHPLTVAVGDELLGHTVDGIGRVTDCDEKDLKLDSEYPIEAPPPDPMSREIISEELSLFSRQLRSWDRFWFTDQAHRILRMRSLICHSAFMLHQVRVLINWSMQLPTYLRLIRLREKKSPSFTWRVKQSRQHRLLKRQKRQIRKKKRKRLLLQRQNLQSQKLQITLKSRLFLIKKLLQAEQSE